MDMRDPSTDPQVGDIATGKLLKVKVIEVLKDNNVRVKVAMIRPEFPGEDNYDTEQILSYFVWSIFAKQP